MQGEGGSSLLECLGGEELAVALVMVVIPTTVPSERPTTAIVGILVGSMSAGGITDVSGVVLDVAGGGCAADGGEADAVVRHWLLFVVCYFVLGLLVVTTILLLRCLSI